MKFSRLPRGWKLAFGITLGTAGLIGVLACGTGRAITSSGGDSKATAQADGTTTDAKVAGNFLSTFQVAQTVTCAKGTESYTLRFWTNDELGATLHFEQDGRTLFEQKLHSGQRATSDLSWHPEDKPSWHEFTFTIAKGKSTHLKATNLQVWPQLNAIGNIGVVFDDTVKNTCANPVPSPTPVKAARDGMWVSKQENSKRIIGWVERYCATDGTVDYFVANAKDVDNSNATIRVRIGNDSHAIPDLQLAPGQSWQSGHIKPVGDKRDATLITIVDDTKVGTVIMSITPGNTCTNN